jgi:glycine cleavage system H lipoate-binding protein
MVALLVLFAILVFLTVDYMTTRPVRVRVPGSSSVYTGRSAGMAQMAERAGATVPAAFDSEPHLAPGHIWITATPSGNVRLGIDKVLIMLLGKVECVYPHPEGTAVGRGGPLFMLRNGNRALKVRSPLDGVITQVNHRARENPDSLIPEVVEYSWIYELTPSRLSRALKGMKRGEEATRWISEEYQRLRDLSLPLMSTMPDGQVSLADGGELTDELGALIEKHVDDTNWEKLVADFFSESQLV